MPPSLLSRRQWLACAMALASPLTAFASETTYGDFVIDDSALSGGLTPEQMTALKAQIDLVNSLKIKDETLSFFRAQRLIIDPDLKQPGRVGPRGLFLSPAPQPAENPVLLHELLHVWHFKAAPDGRENPDIIGFYKAAQAGGFYPKGAYALTNPAEFFAMTASVVLWGRAARPPYKRETVKRDQPDLYDWIVGQFGLQV